MASPHLNNCIAPNGSVPKRVVVVPVTDGVVVAAERFEMVDGCVVADGGVVAPVDGGGVIVGGVVVAFVNPAFCCVWPGEIDGEEVGADDAFVLA